MTTYLAVHDHRLVGGVPSRANLAIVNVNEHTPISQAFHRVHGVANVRGKINSMFILCHGYAGYNTLARMSTDAGGMGLEFCRDDLLHSNVSMWTSIANIVDNIVVYACAAGDTEPGNRGTTADGRYLMGALAIYTKACVFAADRIQWYRTYHGLDNGRFEFGAWEGNLYCFPPDGTGAVRVARAPIELSDVFSGTAP